MSLYAEYIKELDDREIIEDGSSFITYRVFKDNLKVIDLFVTKEARGNNKWNDLMKQIENIAKERKCKTLSAQIEKQAGAFIEQRTSHLCRLFGMKKSYENSLIIIYSREVL